MKRYFRVIVGHEGWKYPPIVVQADCAGAAERIALNKLADTPPHAGYGENFAKSIVYVGGDDFVDDGTAGGALDG